MLSLKLKAPKANKNAFLQNMLKGYTTKNLVPKVGALPKIKPITGQRNPSVVS